MDSLSVIWIFGSGRKPRAAGWIMSNVTFRPIGDEIANVPKRFRWRAYKVHELGMFGSHKPPQQTHTDDYANYVPCPNVERKKVVFRQISGEECDH